ADTRSAGPGDDLRAARRIRRRLILWHGPTGTGKSTAIRALMRAWGSWADFDYIIDADRFFNNPGYVAQVALEPSPLSQGKKQGSIWRIVVVEDADQFLSPEAHPPNGLGLLLNLTA